MGHCAQRQKVDGLSPKWICGPRLTWSSSTAFYELIEMRDKCPLVTLVGSKGRVVDEIYHSLKGKEDLHEVIDEEDGREKWKKERMEKGSLEEITMTGLVRHAPL
ncbi:hypothetical protein AGABI2DRAFT_138153 [Agaricus bisporus var. bisporus H97]|uniref:hypothetical protein n=1 Tax=Agaricus bisporus var. bisporus (strain H97 / ATCC MYA-4626 / FGSC 10389) TaxID=936046 RepID=UPI00029F778F|nr:hypothetical protein AGABI2DRAFT_138153 [Agaricus bisporus var. bisporus H97]EKV44556.1 hypothetical protein AGABI2DRAFT_138153 [Agaricus bisporus var. bisporus H97]